MTSRKLIVYGVCAHMRTTGVCKNTNHNKFLNLSDIVFITLKLRLNNNNVVFLFYNDYSMHGSMPACLHTFTHACICRQAGRQTSRLAGMKVGIAACRHACRQACRQLS